MHFPKHESIVSSSALAVHYFPNLKVQSAAASMYFVSQERVKGMFFGKERVCTLKSLIVSHFGIFESVIHVLKWMPCPDNCFFFSVLLTAVRISKIHETCHTLFM